MQRSTGWTIVRYTEFAILGLSLALGIIDLVQHTFSMSPVALSALAVASKAIRVLLTKLKGLPASTLDATSWALAIAFAVLSTCTELLSSYSPSVVASKDVVEVSSPLDASSGDNIDLQTSDKSHDLQDVTE